MGDPKKVMGGDKGSDPIFSKGDITSKLLFYYKSYNHNFNFRAFSKIGATKRPILETFMQIVR